MGGIIVMWLRQNVDSPLSDSLDAIAHRSRTGANGT